MYIFCTYGPELILDQNDVNMIQMFQTWGGGGGVQSLSFWEHFFEITADPKGPPSGSTFWSGVEAPDPSAPAWCSGHAHFPTKNRIVLKKEPNSSIDR